MKYTVREFWRDQNKYADRIYTSEKTFAVADGMGSGEGGKRAAEKAIQLISKYEPFKSISHLKSFFMKANDKIIKEIALLGDNRVAGTTLSVITFIEDRYLIGHVGDSRIYLFREGTLELLTEDQIVYKSGKKYVSALGLDWNPRIFLAEGKVKRGDVYLIISDGAVYTFSDSELEIIFSYDIESTADKLLDRYLSTIPQEDLSFIIVSID